MSGEMIYGKFIFKILGGISWQPHEFFHFRDLIILIISLSVTGVRLIQGKDFVHTEFKRSSAGEVFTLFSAGMEWVVFIK